jgi:hypothetical protein
VDWYHLVAKSKKTMVVPMKSINWTYMRNKNHPLFNEIITAYEHHKIYDIMAFSYPWNDEIHWMTNGVRCHSNAKVFAQHLNLQAHF